VKKSLIFAAFKTGVNRHFVKKRSLNRSIITLFTPICIFLILFLPKLSISQDTLVILDDFGSMNTGKYFYYHLDDRFLPFESRSADWKKMPGNSYRSERDKSIYFFTVLKNDGSSDRSLKLFLNSAEIGTAVLFLARNDRIDSVAITGSLVETKNRASKDRLMSFPIRISSGEAFGIYIKMLKNRNSITVIPVLSDPARTDPYLWPDHLIVITLATILLIMLAGIVALFYVPASETWSFLAFIFFGFWYVMAASGFGSLYCWSAFPWFEENAVVFFAVATAISFLEFSRKIIRGKKLYARFNAFLIAFNIVYLCLALMGFFNQIVSAFPSAYSWILTVPYGILLVCLIILLEISFYNTFVKKQSRFWWFTMTLLFYAGFTVFTILFELTYIADSPNRHVILIACSVLPQMMFMLVFMTNRIIGFINHKNNEIAKIRLQGQNEFFEERPGIERKLQDS